MSVCRNGSSLLAVCRQGEGMIGEEYSTPAEASWSLRMALWLRGGLSVFYQFFFRSVMREGGGCVLVGPRAELTSEHYEG